MVPGAPAPQHLAGLAVDLDDVVAHDHAVATLREVEGVVVVALDHARVGGEREEVAVRHLMRLVVQRLHIDAHADARCELRVARCIPLVHDVAEQVDLERTVVGAVEQDVAVLELVDARDARVGFVAPDDATVVVEHEQRAPLPHEVELAGAAVRRTDRHGTTQHEQRVAGFGALRRGLGDADPRFGAGGGDHRLRHEHELVRETRGLARRVAHRYEDLVAHIGLEADQRDALARVPRRIELHLPAPRAVIEADDGRHRLVGAEAQHADHGRAQVGVRSERRPFGEDRRRGLQRRRQREREAGRGEEGGSADHSCVAHHSVT